MAGQREASRGGEDVYATLLLTDTYLPGALVLAHSLRDAGTTKKLAALVTLDSLSTQAIAELQSVFDYILPVSRIRNAQPANLQLMNRTDLHSAFTKINLWKQTQFRKIVYIDADVVAYRAPDELFDIDHPFSAAPDIGWPDIFNTGVMVLTPNVGDYYAMMAMAERGISFDGADQGLINIHFRNNYNRISFTYNVTPSAHYQYVPAYRHFQSSINMVHFIGSDKPWSKGRNASIGNSPFDEMTGRWWAVYDRHYRPPPASSVSSAIGGPTAAGSAETTSGPLPGFVQYLTKGEFKPGYPHREAISSKPYEALPGDFYDAKHVQSPAHPHTAHLQESHNYTNTSGAFGPVSSGQEHQAHPSNREARGLEDVPSEINSQQFEPPRSVSSDVISSSDNREETQAEARQEQFHVQGVAVTTSEPGPEKKPEPFQPDMSSWDAQRHPPPAESKPEAMNFPSATYEMSKSSSPFVPPERYPSPPRNMWYEVPKEAPAARSAPPPPIFPWEGHQPKPTRVFVDYARPSPGHEATASDSPRGQPWPLPEGGPLAEPSTPESSTVRRSEPSTPLTPAITITSADSWSSFKHTNAWDSIPAITRSVERYQRRLKLEKRQKGEATSSEEDEKEIPWRRRGNRVTDFPSKDERPSLPVTPAPIHRSTFWGGSSGAEASGRPLPGAADVPGQGDWVCSHGRRWEPADCLCDLTNVLRVHKDPVAQLEKLAKLHSEQLLEKLGGTGRDSSDLPSRLLPFGSENLVSPTYAAQSAKLVSPRPIKGRSTPSSVLSIVSDKELEAQASSSQPTIKSRPDTLGSAT
ncbi:glycosyltransferase family 8 protein [Poronia punctata]|nr:glycosyltransferase family 8 protein [Poronia punctata]